MKYHYLIRFLGNTMGIHYLCMLKVDKYFGFQSLTQ